MATKVGIYSFAASVVTSILIAAIFYVLAIQKVAQTGLYSNTDVYGGMVYVFILAMIVSASVWPGVIEKRLMKR